MPSDRPALRRDAPAVEPDRRAEAQLRYIRETMSRTAEFTAVSGWGGVAMGATALGAAALAAGQPDVEGWLRVWAAEAVVGFAIGVGTTVRKAQRHGAPLLSGQGRKFLLGLAPAIFAGLVVTLAVYGLDLSTNGEGFVWQGAAESSASLRLLPGLWLLLYGAGVVSAGMFSIRPVPLLGAAFLLVGTLALLSPAAWATAWMAVGFGGLHLLSGLHIAHRHGG
jgi:hypothetical protein